MHSLLYSTLLYSPPLLLRLLPLRLLILYETRPSVYMAYNDTHCGCGRAHALHLHVIREEINPFVAYLRSVHHTIRRRFVLAEVPV